RHVGNLVRQLRQPALHSGTEQYRSAFAAAVSESVEPECSQPVLQLSDAGFVPRSATEPAYGFSGVPAGALSAVWWLVPDWHSGPWRTIQLVRVESAEGVHSRIQLPVRLRVYPRERPVVLQRSRHLVQPPHVAGQRPAAPSGYAGG